MKWLKRHWLDILLFVATALFSFYGFHSGGPAVESHPDVVVIRLDGEVENALADFIQKSIREAEKGKAKAVLVEITTFGGRIDAMTDIGEAISTAGIPVHTFVRGKALSAGAYIALSGKKIIMTSEAVMGASEPRTADNRKVDDEKVYASLRGLFRAAAEARRDRGISLDPTIAEAMVDSSVEVATPGIKKPGQLVVLTGGEALRLGYCDGLASTRRQALSLLGLEEANARVITPSPAQRLARVLTNPVVSTILIIAGVLGILIEVVTPGFGVPGGLGLLSFALFFGARLVSNLAGWEVVALFIIGVFLMVLEALAPGFGILGLSGIAALAASIILAYPSRAVGAWSVAIATLWLILLGRVVFRALGAVGAWKRMVLQTSQTKEEGYVAVSIHPEWMGREGVALTTMRPVGAIEIDDQRIDAITEGEFVPANTPVRVIRVEGNRVVVRAIRPKIQ